MAKRSITPPARVVKWAQARGLDPNSLTPEQRRAASGHSEGEGKPYHLRADPDKPLLNPDRWGAGPRIGENEKFKEGDTPTSRAKLPLIIRTRGHVQTKYVVICMYAKWYVNQAPGWKSAVRLGEELDAVLAQAAAEKWTPEQLAQELMRSENPPEWVSSWQFKEAKRWMQEEAA